MRSLIGWSEPSSNDASSLRDREERKTTDEAGMAVYEREQEEKARTKERITEAVARLVDGTGLHVQELPCELVITNPDDPENGRLHVDLEHGYMSWERVVWDFWGTVTEGLGEEGTRVVTKDTIVGVLGELKADGG